MSYSRRWYSASSLYHRGNSNDSNHYALYVDGGPVLYGGHELVQLAETLNAHEAGAQAEFMVLEEAVKQVAKRADKQFAAITELLHLLQRSPVIGDEVRAVLDAARAEHVLIHDELTNIERKA